ncbi:MAG: glycosyltransferase family 4 protein [Deltaproteobacteria bacterium]|nr:glycosyltransferase family 4 protein [Deltaproteobacteria bacterium]MBW2026043.1 glycosyltransferase family 4 protein [Deltaproteobacteria bacterium]MBW2126007.1 glycosyltransferase family 4 protein [Deltaproteobacteria bacterium]
MKIVVDLQGAQTESRFRGIGRYALSLTLSLARQAKEHELWIVLNSSFPETIEPLRAAFEGIIPQERIVVFDIPGPSSGVDPLNLWRTRTAELVREHFFTMLAPDVVLITSLFEGWSDNAVTSVRSLPFDGLCSVIFYDLIPLLRPKTYLADHRFRAYYYRKLSFLKSADLLFAISESSASEAIKELGFPEDRVINISGAVDKRFKPLSLSRDEANYILSRLGITGPFVLYTGGFDARKNLEALIKAFSLLPEKVKQNYELVIAGKVPKGNKDRLLKLGKRFGVEPRLVFTGYIGDRDLVALYNLCSLSVLPSFHEGFGLTALEAMACGAPVIGSNSSSIPEVIGRDDVLFDPARPEAIARKMEDVLENPEFARLLREYGLERAKLFSWERSAGLVLEEFERRVGRRTRKKVIGADPTDENPIQNRINPTTVLVKSIGGIPSERRPSELDLLMTARAIAGNLHLIKERPRLLVDVSQLVAYDAKTGIQRVVRSILRNLIKSPMESYEVQLIYYDGHVYRYAYDFLKKFADFDIDGKIDEPLLFTHKDTFLGLDFLPHIIPNIEPFLCFLRNKGVKIFFVVYDLLPIVLSHTFPPRLYPMFLRWLEIISGVSDGLIGISRSVARELEQWLSDTQPPRIRPLKLGYFHLGADVESDKQDGELPDDYEIILEKVRARTSFLMVGTIEPRKGYAQVLDAFELLWERGKDLNLIIVGKEGWMVKELVKKLRFHPECSKRLFWLEGVSDEMLLELYRSCSALLMASEGEGFGLPLIEAARHNLPIIARDLPVFREIAGENAFYFSGISGKGLAQAIDNWLELWKLGKAPQSDLIPCLTWRQSADDLISLVTDSNDPRWISTWKPRIEGKNLKVI